MLAKIAGHPTTVWIVGSSIVRDGFIEAKMQPGGINLSLKKRLGVSIWWQGRGGLTLRKLKNHIRLLMRLEDTPDYVVIHIWGNDRLEDTPDYILIHIGGDDRLEDTLDYILIHIWGNDRLEDKPDYVVIHIWGNDRLEDTPDYVVIHIRGNDIGDIRVGHLHYLLVRFMSWFTLHYLLVRFMSWLTLHYLLVRFMSWLTLHYLLVRFMSWLTLHYLLVRFMSWLTLHYLLVRFMSWLTLHYLLVRFMSWLTLHYLLVRFMSWLRLHYLLVRFMSWLTLHYLLVRSMSWLTQMMPQTGLIWSAILPRLTWKYSENNDRMEKCRRRLNSSMGLHMVRHGSYYIKYPEIKADRRFLKTDGVHLTKIGNQVFLNILQGTIEQFVKSKVGGLTFPDLY